MWQYSPFQLFEYIQNTLCVQNLVRSQQKCFTGNKQGHKKGFEKELEIKILIFLWCKALKIFPSEKIVSTNLLRFVGLKNVDLTTPLELLELWQFPIKTIIVKRNTECCIAPIFNKLDQFQSSQFKIIVVELLTSKVKRQVLCKLFWVTLLFLHVELLLYGAI